MCVAPSSPPVVRSNVRKLYAAGPFGSAGTAGRPSAGLPHTIRLGAGGGMKHVHPALVNRAAVTPPSAATGATSTRADASTAITNNGNRINASSDRLVTTEETSSQPLVATATYSAVSGESSTRSTPSRVTGPTEDSERPSGWPPRASGSTWSASTPAHLRLPPHVRVLVNPGGVQLFYVARIMGTSVQQIDQTYGHLLPDSEEYLRSLLNAYDDVYG